MNTDNRKNLKTDRIKSFFLEAAKEIILEEGAENVTVRKIADLSGYSYGTIYHYFKDLNDLMFEVKNLIIQEMIVSMDQNYSDMEYSEQEIKIQIRMFIDYFVKNPNIYGFLYKYQLKNTTVTAFDEIELGEAYWDTFEGLVEKKKVRKEDVPVIAKTMIYGMYGLLALYFSSNGLTEEKLYKEFDEMMDYILRGKL